MKAARTVLRVATLVTLVVALSAQTAFAIQPEGKPTVGGARGWSQVFTEINTVFDHVQFYMVNGAFDAPYFEGIVPPDPPDQWMMMNPPNPLLVIAEGTPAALVQYRLYFAGNNMAPLTFYYQVWDGEVIVTEETVNWVVDPLQGGPNWFVTGGSPWSNVRVNYDEVPVDNATLTLIPDEICYDVGDSVVVDIKMTNAPQLITGGQFFLSFNPSKLAFVSVDPGDAPFTNPIAESVNPLAGTIDYSVGVPFGNPGTMADTVMARVTFTAINEACKKNNLVTFRQHSPPTRLTAACGDPIYCYLFEQGPITIDSTPPEFATEGEPGTYCIGGDPDDPDFDPADWTYTVECDAIDAEYPVYDLFSELLMQASDNCTLDEDIVITFDEQRIDGDCVDRYTLVRTWTATDECGNFKRCQYYLAVVDTGSPCLHGCPQDVSVECDEIPPEPVIGVDIWADDNCDPAPVITFQSWTEPEPGMTPEEDCNYYLYREWTATDRCGNHSVCTQEIYVYDATPPYWIDDVTDPANPWTDRTVECNQIPPRVDPLAGDNCDTYLDLDYQDIDSDHQCPDTYTKTRIWTYTDNCDLFIQHVQHITVQDTTPPVLSHDLEAEITINCEDVPGLPGPLAVSATDNCDLDVSISFLEFVTEDDSQDCDYPYSYTLTRTWTATDQCDNSTSFTQIVHVQDIEPPQLVCPPDISVDADVGTCSWTHCPPVWATATDNCDPDPLVVGYRSDNMPLCGYPYPAFDEFGNPTTTTITWVATDECDNESTCEQIITVRPFNKMEVLLANQVNEVVTRCITFVLWNCGDPLQAPVVVEREMTFDQDVPGHPDLKMAVGSFDDIPCGFYDCITARDPWHSLRRTTGLIIEGNHYLADFVVDPEDPVKPLLGGNANDDMFIDILDFGLYNSWYGWTYPVGGDTPCGWFCMDYPAGVTCCAHADFGGDGMVGPGGDFSYLQINFGLEAEPDCCVRLSMAGSGEPITDISLAELRELGMGYMEVADLNHDGRLNTGDIGAYLNGARPGPVKGQEQPQSLQRLNER